MAAFHGPEEERSLITTGPVGGARPGGSGPRSFSLPGNEPGARPAEIAICGTSPSCPRFS